MSRRQGTGPQVVDRPSGWREGGRAPWADLEDHSLDVARLEAALRSHRPGRVERAEAPAPDRTAAVLVPLYELAGGATVVLTRRSAGLRSHGHEVSFPGGGHDPADDDHWTTALREAHEEVGLDPRLPRRIGELDTLMTVGSRSWIHPYVAALDDPPDLVPDPTEVELILRVSLADLLAEGVFSEELWPIRGSIRAVSFFDLDGDTVWGATAAMLRQLLCLGLGIGDGRDRESGPGVGTGSRDRE